MKSEKKRTSERKVLPLTEACVEVSTPSKKPRSKRLLPAALGAIAVLAGAMWFGGATSDDVSPAQRQQLEAEFQNASYTMERVNWVNPAQRASALAALGLDKDNSEHAKMIAAFDAAGADMGWVIVWDNFAEDGDVVQVTANGITQEVPILNTPTRVLVPYPETGFVQITGVIDGGGGITAAATGPSGEVRFPPLAVGQSIQLPVR
ncbi:MAG: hypothetical protein AB8G17_21550 [Gammaproteobacteria bacterium]